MYPSAATREMYRALQPLISNPIVDLAFAAREASGNRAKNLYHWLGRIALGCVIAGAVFVIAQALILRSQPSRYVGISVGIMAGIGLMIQLYLIFTKQKQLWLNNRFAAERLRSIKFQAYALALSAASTEDLRVEVDAFYTREVALLDNELNAARSVLRTFSPHASLSRLPVPGADSTGELARQAAEAYAELRVRYQTRFASDEAEKLQSTLRVDYAIADILYLVGASCTVGGLVFSFAAPLATALVKWIEFVAVAAFILGLGKTLMDNASLSEETRMRYLDYLQGLEAAQEARDPLSVTILKIERAALEELRQFCQSANRISYRL